MSQDIFADTFANIAVTGGLVRIDLGSLVPPPQGSEQAQLAVKQRLIMPLDGFVRSFGMSEDVMKKLLDAGIIQKREPGESAAQPTQEKPVEAKSPNFA